MTYPVTLLNDLPSFFDKQSWAVPILAIEATNPTAWSISGEILTVARLGVAHTLDLTTYTIQGLAEVLRQLGYTTPILDQAYATCEATLLIDGAGTATCVTLHGYTSVLWWWTKVTGRRLTITNTDQDAMLAQMILPQAYQGWADFWGWYFGVPRITGETDAVYTARIQDEVYRKRNNPLAIEANVERYTGCVIDLFEPWTQMWRLSKSVLSGQDHFPGSYYAYHILHPLTEESVDWPTCLAVIEADRPAGSTLRSPTTIRAGQVIDFNVAGEDGSQIAHGHTPLIQKIYRVLSGAWLSVNAILSDARVQHVPDTLVGHLRAAIVDAFDPVGSFSPVRTDTYTRIIYTLEVQGCWIGAWDGDTWAERGALMAVTLPSQTTVPAGEAWAEAVTVTGSAGTLVAEGNDTRLALEALSAPAASGTLTVSGAVSLTLTGNAASGSAGTLTIAPVAETTLIGAASTATPGTLTATTTGAVTLAGAAATSALGNDWFFNTYSALPLTGNAATSAIGTAVGAGNQPDTFAGLTATSAAGTLVAEGNSPSPLDGLCATTGIGILTPSGAASVTLTGNAATSAAGDPSPTATVTVTLAGVKSQTHWALLTVSAGCTVILQSKSRPARIGTLIPYWGSSLPLTGNAATPAAGILTAETP